MKTFLTTILLALTVICSAKTVTGTVKNKKTGQVLIGVRVGMGNNVAYTDRNGNFQFTSDKTTDHIICSYSGYKSVSKAYNKENDYSVTIKMEEINESHGTPHGVYRRSSEDKRGCGRVQ